MNLDGSCNETRPGGLPGADAGGGMPADEHIPSLPPDGGKVKLFVDGCCEPRNPGGWACWGWLALRNGGDFFLATGKGCAGYGEGMTNNLAEYRAAIEALRWAAGQGLRAVLLCSDSQLVVNQATGRWQCSAAHLWPLLAELRSLMAETGAVLQWIPREENGRADQLSRLAYAEARRAVAP